MTSLLTFIEEQLLLCEKDNFSKANLQYSELAALKTNQQFFGYYQDQPKGSGKYLYFMHLLTKHYDRFKNIVELGNREGLSTLAVSTAMSEGQHFTSIDIIKDLRFVSNSIRESTQITFLFGDCLSSSVLDAVPKNIDLILFDTIHSYQQVSQEWNKYKPLLSDEAVVLIDDINFADKRRILSELGDECVIFENEFLHSSGFAVIVFNRKNK